MKKLISILLCLSLLLGLAVAASAASTAGLVTSASKLADGQEIVIACIDKSVAMGAISSTYGSSIAATISDDQTTLTMSSDLLVITLEAHASNANTYAFKVDGGYLNCTSTKKLAIQNTAKYWSIEIADSGSAIITCEHVDDKPTLQYNSGSPRFTTYTSSQGSVAIYAVGVAGSTPAAAPTDPAEIIRLAYALAEGEKLPYTSTLTGTISEDLSATSWGALIATIIVDGFDDKPIVCFGLTGSGTGEIAKGDTITVTGTLMNYGGTIEFGSGCTLDSYVKNSSSTPEETPQLPAADSTLTIPEANDAASLAGSSYSKDKYYVTGVITKIVNDEYGNIYIKDAEDNSLYIYGLYSDNGEVRFDAMDPQPKVGDTITIYTILGTYKNNPQAKNAWMTEHIPASEDEEPNETPEETPTETVGIADGTYVIYNYGHNVALSSQYDGYYNMGISVSVSGSTMTGFAATEIWTVKNNDDGTITISCADGVLSQGGYSSMGMNLEHDKWVLEKASNGAYFIKNVGTGKYMEWYSEYETFSTYYINDDSDTSLFAMQFCAVAADGTTATVPATGDSISVIVAMLLISAAGITVIAKKKEF